jgi:hypothetical protein
MVYSSGLSLLYPAAIVYVLTRPVVKSYIESLRGSR